MNSDEIKSLIVKVLIMVLSPLGTKFGIDGNTVASIASWLAAGLVLAYSIYDHWNEKKVPEKATPVILPPNVPTPKPGTTIDLAPLSGLAKVVGVFAMLIASVGMLDGGTTLARAKELHLPLTGNVPVDIANAVNSAEQKTGVIGSQIAQFLSDLAAIDDAVTLSTQIPELQDPVGNACWTQFAPVQTLIKAHPLPLSFKIASDIEAARLLAIAMNKVCANPNCGQMFIDATNAANALASVPVSVSLGSLCSKIPVIGTAAVAPATAAPTLVGTTVPAATGETPAPVK